MIYSLVFTIYSLIFMTMLLITLIMKVKKKPVRTKLYILLIIYSMACGIMEIKAIYTLCYIDPIKDKLAVNWEFKNIFMFQYIFMFILYSITVLKGTNAQKLKDFFLKNIKVLIPYVALCIFCAWYLLAENFKYFGPDQIKYIGVGTTGLLFGFGLIAIFIALGIAFKQRKENKNIYNCFLLIFISFIIIFSIQILIPSVSFIPFLLMFVLYIIYHNIENPDIELLEEVTLLKGQIDKSSNAKTDFLFNLSYDLVNPMNVIVSLSESLSNIETYDKDMINRDLKSIKYAGNTLLDSIDNILDLSESDEQDNMINEKEYGLYELLKRMEAVAIARIGAKQITFEMNIDDNISSKLLGDITKIQKILLNIINNAAKYTEIGKIKMDVTCTNDKDVQVLHFKISDTGNGIKDEIKPFIFTDSQETSGVGLALTKKYVEAMKGKINFESVYGAGTTFNIEIPQKIVGTRLISEDKKEDVSSETIEFIDCSQYKALIVDDDILDIKVTKRLIEKYKFQITTITSSSECIDRIKSEEEYDILFLDHKMPEIDGMQTMKILKGLEGYKIPKIIALTANAVTGAREYYLKEGFDDYISKPIDTHELDRIIKRNFNKKA